MQRDREIDREMDRLVRDSGKGTERSLCLTGEPVSSVGLKKKKLGPSRKRSETDRGLRDTDRHAYLC